MTFSEKLKKTMQELHLNQSQVCGLTGKSKGSVSQYLSGKQIPSEKVQSDIAVSLGLAPDYFTAEEEKPAVIAKKPLQMGKSEGCCRKKRRCIWEWIREQSEKAYSKGCSRGGMRSRLLKTDGLISSMRTGSQR